MHKIPIHGHLIEDVINLDIDDYDLDNENTLGSILDAFLQCMNHLCCCLYKLRRRKIKRNRRNEEHNVDEIINIMDSDIDSWNNKNTRHSISKSFLRCINCCRNKKRYPTERQNKCSAKYSIQKNSDEDDGVRRPSALRRSSESLNEIYITPSSEMAPSVSWKKKTNKNLCENFDNENDENRTCHASQLSHESDESMSICSILSQLTPTDSVKDEEIDEILSENVGNDDASNLRNLAELLTSDDQGEDCKWGNEDCYESIVRTLKIISNTIKEDLSKSVIRRKLHIQLTVLLKHSTHKNTKLYLLENNFLHIVKTILRALVRPWSIIIQIIINICSNDKAIDFIGNDKEFVTLILNHFKYSVDYMFREKYLELLLLITSRIQRDFQSPWMSHLINHKLLGTNVIEMLNKITHDELTLAESLLRLITEMTSLRSHFLQRVFKMKKLFFTLLTFFIQVVPAKEGKYIYSSEELRIIQCWLMLMTTMKQHILFKNFSRKTFLVHMEIIYRILEPYSESHVLAPTLETKLKNSSESPDDVNLSNIQCVCNVPRSMQNISIIHHSMNMMISLSFDNIPDELLSLLMNIIYCVKTTVPEFEIEESLDKEVTQLLDHLIQFWIRIVESYDYKRICKILYLCKPETCECVIDIIRYDIKSSSEVLEKLEEVVRRFDFIYSSSFC